MSYVGEVSPLVGSHKWGEQQAAIAADFETTPEAW